MLKRVKGVLFALMLVALTATAFFGCSFGGGSSTKGATTNRVYIIKTDDYSEFCDNMFTPADGEKKKKEEYTVPAVSELTIGETYYVVAFTSASTSDGSDVMFGKNGSLIMQSSTPNVKIEDAVDVIDTFGTSSWLNRDYNNEAALEFSVSPSTSGSKAEFTACVEFEVKEEIDLSVEYHINGTVKKNTYGVGSSVKTSASALYPDKIELSNLKVSYLSSDNYVDGRYEQTALVDSMNMKVGREYYMVITANIRSELTESSKLASFNMKISPRNLIDGTLEEAGSGTFDETTTETEKNITVSFKIPEPEEGSKEITFIIKLTPVSIGNPNISYGFFADKISIIGNGAYKSGEKTLIIDGEEKCSEGFEYTLSADKSYYTVTELGEAKGSILLIPAEYNSLPVKAIGANAFKGFTRIKSIEVSEGIVSIGANAFSNCTGLLEISLPSTVTSMGNYVLSGCISLNTLTVNLGGKQLKALFGSSNTSVPTSLKTVTLVGDTTLCASAFAGGTKIEKLTLPATLTTVDASALSGCTSLSELKLASGSQSLILQCGILYDKATVAVLGHVAKFSGEMTYPAGLTEIPGGDMSAVTKITVPDTVTKFSGSVSSLAPSYASGPLFLFGYVTKTNLTTAIVTTGETAPSFSGATKLTSVTLPSSVTSLQNNAFYGCESLKTVNLPSGITVIPYSAFYGCKALTSLTLPSTVVTISEKAFFGCEAIETISIPSGLTSLGKSAFTNCKKLTSAIKIPSGMNNVPEYLCDGCESLTSVTIPEGVVYIYSGAFRGCSSLKSVTLPSTVTHIYSDAFRASGLTGTVNISKKVTYLVSNAYADCEKLTAFTVEEGHPNFAAEGGILYNATKTEIELVPAGISGTVTLSSTLKAIRDGTFDGCDKITKIVIRNSSGICIVPYAFEDCAGLEQVELRNSVGGLQKSIMTYNSSKKQMGYVSWDDAYELESYLKGKYSDRYFGNPDNLK